jgi:hypothetical protein
MMYFGSSESALMIFVHLATWKNQNTVCTWQIAAIICYTLQLNSTVPAQTGCLMLIILDKSSTATEISWQNVIVLQKQILNYNVVVLCGYGTCLVTLWALTVLEHTVIRAILDPRQLTNSELNQISHNLQHQVLLKQTCTNPMHQVAWAINLCTAVHNVCWSSVWNLLHVTLLASRIWGCVLLLY